MASTAIVTGAALPRGGAKSEKKTETGAHLESVAQRIRFKRKFFDKVIGGPEVQYARLSTDAGGFKTYLSPSEYGRLNPVEQIFCEPAKSSNSSITRPDQFQRVCYICGFKLFGKDAIKRGYPDGGKKGTEYLKDWRYPQIEHVMNMMEGTQYGAVTRKIPRGELLRERKTEFKYPEYNPDDTPSQKLQYLINEVDVEIADRNEWPVQWYEYLWSHLLCNQVKSDVRFMRVQINKGTPVWESNDAQIDSTQKSITGLLEKHKSKNSITKWINASNQWWNQEPDQLKRYIKVFCQRMTFQNMGSTNKPRATHEWAPSPGGEYNHFKFDKEALQSTKTKMNPPHDQMWRALLVGGEEGPREDRNVKKAFTWIKSKLLGVADKQRQSKYLKDSKAAWIAIPAFLKEEVDDNVPKDIKWNEISKIPVETRREAFLLLPDQQGLRAHYNKYAELFTKIFGDAEKAEQTESKAITLQDGPDDPETQNPEFNSRSLQAFPEKGSPPRPTMVPQDQGTPQASLASQQASQDMSGFPAASLGGQSQSQGDQSQMPQRGSPALSGATPQSAGIPRKSQRRIGLRRGALAEQFERSELTTVREDELVGEEDLTDTINMIEKGLNEEDDEEEERDRKEDMRMAEKIVINEEFEKAQAQQLLQILKRTREDDETESDLEDQKRPREGSIMFKKISELSGGDGLSELYNKVLSEYNAPDNINMFKEQNIKPGDGKDYSKEGILARFFEFLNREL